MRVTAERDVPVEQWPLSRLLITASRLVEHDIAVDLRPYHLTHASFGVLALVQGGSMSQRQLAGATGSRSRRSVRPWIGSNAWAWSPREGPRRPAPVPDHRHRTGQGCFPTRDPAGPGRTSLEGLPDAEHLRVALATLIDRLGGHDYVPAVDPD